MTKDKVKTKIKEETQNMTENKAKTKIKEETQNMTENKATTKECNKNMAKTKTKEETQNMTKDKTLNVAGIKIETLTKKENRNKELMTVELNHTRKVQDLLTSLFSLHSHPAHLIPMLFARWRG